MSSAPAATGAAMPPTVAAGSAIDPRLQAVIKQLPADQQAAAMAKLQSMSPADQAALLAQVQQAQAQAQQGGTAAAAP
ncbi:MAG: hypothetical protein JWM98_1993, partial [Thermoleophilia bacterium]|nr:hypothetical protein [Thermoleophilia bacterium]